MTTFVSATGPGAQPHILKNATQKKVGMPSGAGVCRAGKGHRSGVLGVARPWATGLCGPVCGVASGGPAGSSRPSCLRPPPLEQDVQLQNANAWASLTAGPPAGGAAAASGAAHGAAPGADVGVGGAPGGSGEAVQQDELWTEFQGREAAQQQAEQQRRAAEEEVRRKAEAEAAEARRRAEEAAAAAAAASREREAARAREIEEARARDAQQFQARAEQQRVVCSARL